AWQDLNSAW
nr:myoinhibitory peptide:ISOTYPE=I [Manduca sexta]